MYGYNDISVNDKGHLEISGCDCTYLADEYKTPLFIMDEHEIRNRCRQIKKYHMDKYNGFAVYASKAFECKEMYRIINSEGLGTDVVSGGELYTAHAAGFNMKNVVFHGNNKSYEELEMAVDMNVGRIIIDNFYEIELLKDILKKKNKKVTVMLRISPGIHADTHRYISTGDEDSKFGFPMNDDSALRAVSMILKEDNIFKLSGIHSHIGSQISSCGGYIKEVEVLCKFYKQIYDKFNYTMDEVDVGGGFGIFYTDGDERRSIDYYTDVINNTVIEESKKTGIKKPAVIIEPGRWIVGEAGVTLYKAGAIKDVSGIRKYISVDGGMTDNPRPELYDAKYSAVVANKAAMKNAEVVTIAGKCCESGDIVIKDISLPKIESGDIIAVFSTGAYHYSMASNYNKIPKPAVVMVNKGNSRIIIKRETYDDLIRYDI